VNKRLGKGLDALIPPLDVREDDQVIFISLDKLRPNPYQPRKKFDDKSIEELGQSIKEHGVIQPIIVRSVIKGYEIIAGERRWRASMQAELDKIPAVVRSLSDREVMEIALIENIQREDLNAIEIAESYQNLIEQFNLTQEELSAKVGKSRPHIANFLRILQLPEEIKEYVSRGTLSMGHARAIVGIEGNVRRKSLANKAIERQWSVRELEEAIKEDQHKDQQTILKKDSRKDRVDPFIGAIEENLRTRLKTKVKIKQYKDKGKIEISYFSNDDLERLLRLLATEESV